MGNDVLQCNSVDVCCCDVVIKCDSICNKSCSSNRGSENPQELGAAKKVIEFSEQTQKEDEPPESSDRILMKSAKIEAVSTMENQQISNPLSSGNSQHLTDSSQSNQRNERQEESQNQHTSDVSESADSPYDLVIICRNSLIIQRSNKGVGMKLEELCVPSDVIRLSFNASMRRLIEEQLPNFFDETNGSGEWKLRANGFYYREQSPGLGALVYANKLYQGSFREETNQQGVSSLQPHTKGIFICSDFVYNGQIANKVPNGYGILHKKSKNRVYDGIWKDGEMTSGRYKDSKVEYFGQWSNNRPHGQGEIKILAKDIIYVGRFHEGKFEAGLYDCPSYVYKGGFKNGFKEGEGVLTVKDSGKKITAMWVKDKIKTYLFPKSV